MKALLLIGFVSALGLGCPGPTTFNGEATFPKGARGCYDQCIADGMEMAAYVYVGRYSTACACRLKGTAAQPSEAGAVAAQAAAAAGVEMQRRRAAEQARYTRIKPKPKPAEPLRPIYRP